MCFQLARDGGRETKATRLMAKGVGRHEVSVIGHDKHQYTKDDQVSPLCFGLTQEQLGNESEREENIKKMLSQMEVIHEHMNGTYGLFRVEEGSPSGYLRLGRIKVRTPKELRGVLHPYT
ncbi:hypothetical protein H5410_027740 [Solanum commersonii]|uniref:Uncharacterized protein n=1 Tax=Solanum commersonii TaxID=4109 RepID=A0A9J5Z2R5_SOLCO|nr:hypothetical protein H5410_027740 [Solanum commersonii]